MSTVCREHHDVEVRPGRRCRRCAGVDVVPPDPLDALDDLRATARSAVARPVLPERITARNVEAVTRDAAARLAAADHGSRALDLVEQRLAAQARALYADALPVIDAALARTFAAAAAVVVDLADRVAAHGTAQALVAAGGAAVDERHRYDAAVTRLDAVAAARRDLADALSLADRRVPEVARYVDDTDRDTLRRIVDRWDAPRPGSPFVHAPDLADRWRRVVREGAVLRYRSPDEAVAVWSAVTTREPVVTP